MFEWDKDKDVILRKERGIGFEDIVEAIDSGGLVDVYDHPNQDRYPSQKIYVVKTSAYVYLMPFVIDGEKRFLKTIIPSRKAKKHYKG